MRRRLREWGSFLLVQIFVCAAVYGSALWGARILAPLDIAPAVFPAYRFVDPSSNRIPANHYLIDQLTYDLPLQTVIHEAYQRGEIPWWDPYTHGGRPLLADAHINGTDPIRVLCYLFLPFELAYNWNLVLHSVVTAAGMFALLGFWKFGLFTRAVLAVSWQFSGSFVMHFGHPWIAGTFVWFPFVWLCWERALTEGHSLLRNAASAALLCGASFYSGNLQSHLYLPVFGLCFFIGHLSSSRGAASRAAAVLLASGVLGAALAAPVLANQLELFSMSVREVVQGTAWWKHAAKAVLSMGGIFPWATGTFRSLDIGKVAAASGAAWVVFCGSATFALFLVGLLFGGTAKQHQRALWRTSVCLIATYVTVVATPLVQIFYLRIAPLAVLGMIPLAAVGLEFLTAKGWLARPKLAMRSAAAALCLFVALNAAVLLLYPLLKDTLKEAVMEADSTSAAFPSGASTLRSFQVENLPDEVSLKNPETLFSLLSLLLISAAFGIRSEEKRRYLAGLALLFSIGPLLGFAARYVPDQPVEMFARLRAGGPEQRQAIDLVAKSKGRLLDRETQIFPYAMAALYRVRTIHGYSALQPPGVFRQPEGTLLPANFGADFAVNISKEGSLVVEALSSAPPMGRLVPADGCTVEVAEETLNQMRINLAGGSCSWLYLSDTPYPGWRSTSKPGATLTREKARTLVAMDDGASQSRLTLSYTPNHLGITTATALTAAMTVVVLLAASLRTAASHRAI